MAKAINRIVVDPVKRANLEKRYWPKVNVAGPTQCWEWKSPARHPFGYGRMTAGRGVHLKAHQIGWALQNGPIPRGKDICHRCDNPSCSNPNHLFLASHKENMSDAKRKGRMSMPPTHFGSAHPNSKITEELALAIFECPMNTMDTSRKFGVSYRIASCIRNGKTWCHVTGHTAA